MKSKGGSVGKGRSKTVKIMFLEWECKETFRILESWQARPKQKRQG